MDVLYFHSGAVTQCAQALKDSDYKLKTAIRYILEDPQFLASLGNQIRWPLDVVIGTQMDAHLPKLSVKSLAQRVSN